MVFSILSVQLAVILMIILWFFFHQWTKQTVKDYVAIFYVSVIILVVSVIAVAFCDKRRRNSPSNYYFLFILTLALSFFLGCLTAKHDSAAIPMAVGITVVICLGITSFVLKTKYNFTLIAGVLLVGFLELVILIFVTIFIDLNIMLPLAEAIFLSMFFSLYLVYDTQIMMGGKHGTHMYSISHQEFIFAVLNLYVDGINIFRHLWTKFGK
ncbi:unnamed protein product [Psylliodes chrysocephalus]|uniref:Uncharacterized protein n=1 Tax=Psylliodes chrysocephalus TaxID=3402493 RepID=A0A9P0CE26_9CUCU|nr:unnamed protein product [Psylliodes chrysocephala]